MNVLPHDFADWLSPVVVKELRQGMRTRMFVSALLLLQLAMAFAMLISAITPQGPNEYEGMFWTLVAVPLLLVLPMRGMGAVSEEVKANTLELVHLTRLTAWRIVLGKWTALALQTLLLACTALPYIVLRYFLGGVNLLEELGWIGWITLGSLFLSTLSVAGSAMLKPWMLRLVAGGGGMVALYAGGIMLSFGGFPGSVVPAAYAWLIFPGFAILLGALALEFGAGAIAPEAENHAARQRLLALVALGALMVLAGPNPEPPRLILPCVIIIPVVVLALCETISPVRTIYAPFVKRGVLGRLAGRFLYPGWPAGVFFAVAVTAIMAWPFLRPSARHGPADGQTLTLIALTGAVFTPMLLARLMPFKKKLPVFFGAQIAMAIFAALAGAATGTPETRGLLSLVAPFPTSVFLLTISSVPEPAERAVFLRGTGLVTLASIAGLVALALLQERRIQALEREARAGLAPPRASATPS